MKIEKIGNRVVVTLDQVECTGQDTLIEVAVNQHGTNRVAKTFISATQKAGGVKMSMTVKRNEFHDETERSAVATFGTPVPR